MQRTSVRAVVTAAVLFAAACSSSSTPSTFGTGGGSEGGVTDGGSMETGSFGGSSGGGSFQCGAAMSCTRYDYCLFIVSDAGTEMSATCNLLGNCGDCNCVMQMVSAAQCAGLRVTCTPNPPYTVTCLPPGSGSSSGGSTDSGSAD